MFTYRCPRCLQRLAIRGARLQSTTASDAANPPLMAKIRGDLKSAMKAKDSTRLNVLRSIIAEVNNASKSASPIRTDLQVLALLRKKSNLSREAAHQFEEAKRDDLKAKEDAQVNVVEEYIGQVEVMAEEDVEKIVKETIDSLSSSIKGLKVGQVLQKLFEPGGVLDAKPVERKSVAQMVAKLLK